MTPDELRKVIEQDENTRVEFKEALSEEVARKLSRSIAAMANSEGGMIIFGVTKDKELVGCELDGEGRNRISQEAGNCRPVVKIGLEEVSIGNKKTCIVTVPKSVVVHNDFDRRFPIRIGIVTEYLEVTGLVVLMRERGLLTSEQTQRFYETPTRERMPIPASGTAVLKEALDSADQAVRDEALQDLNSMAYRYFLLEDTGIVTSVEHLLKSGTDKDRYLTLDALNSIALHANETELQIIKGWVSMAADIAKSSPDARAARSAFELLRHTKAEEIVGVLVHWVTQADDERYGQLQPKGLISGGMSELKGAVHDSMYRILRDDKGANVRKRASEILETLRQRYD